MLDSDGGSALLASVVAYFERSNFQYLALEHASLHIRLARECIDDGRDELRNAGTPARSQRVMTATEVVSPSVGVVELPLGSSAFPRAGATVEQGELLLIIRKFRSAIEVRSPLRGVIESIPVSRGEFVEFSQVLMTIG